MLVVDDNVDAVLDRALDKLVAPGRGPPAPSRSSSVGTDVRAHTAGVADVQTTAKPRQTDHMRIASTAKAFSGAVALSLVAAGKLSLADTIGTHLAGQGLPPAWSGVTLGQALHHTSGLPDYSSSPTFGTQFAGDPKKQLDPRRIWTFVADQPLHFAPGSSYEYSNTDNVIVALMAEAAAGQQYEQLLEEYVYRPLGLRQTSLPSGFELPRPYLHGYDVEPPNPPEDVSEAIGASGAWSSGGIVSTPDDLNAFGRAYAGATLLPRTLQQQQMAWVDGTSEPPGPGHNAAGLGIFRYRASCGAVYGHTGNFPGYTQFFAATLDGRRSVTVSVNEAINDRQKPEILPTLREVYDKAVCAALTR